MSSRGQVRKGADVQHTSFITYEPTYLLNPGRNLVQFQRKQPSPASRQLSKHLSWEGTSSLGILRYTAASSVTVVCISPIAAVNVASGVFEFESNTQVVIQLSEGTGRRTTPMQAEAPRETSSILEMRPAHRSLRDVAREKMSEFEHNYPW
jgi:hypothetical protein